MTRYEMNNNAIRARVRQILVHIHSSLWFVPALIILGAIFLATGLVEMDEQLDQELRRWWPRFFATEAEGARAVLSAIATSMATVAGVVFSITIVALALASTQYTSRVLRNFMRDRSTQVVLGVFVGVYIYCLLVLRTISGGGGAFVPAAAVLAGVVLAVVASGFFIFFIHHVSTSIQASEIAAAITRETRTAIDRLFPNEVGEESEEKAVPEAASSTPWFPVPALALGYIQAIEPDALLALARKYEVVIRMECGIGDFAAPGKPLVSLTLAHPPPEKLIKEVNDIYAISTYRTIDQDAAFGLRQLVDISLKALSPSVNDTTTAVTCVEHLGFLLSLCARRKTPDSYRFEEGQLRVIAHGPTFEYLVSLSFNQIIENAEGNTEILTRVLMALEQIALVTCSKQRREILAKWVETVADVAQRSAKSDHATQELDRHLQRTRHALAPGIPR